MIFGSEEADADGLAQLSGGAFVHVLDERRKVRPQPARPADCRWGGGRYEPPVREDGSEDRIGDDRIGVVDGGAGPHVRAPQ